MKLPCQVLFPDLWHGSVKGMTANMHRKGVLVSCNLRSDERELPAVGQKASIRIQLPANHTFTQKCMECVTTLVRVRRAGDTEWHLGMRIEHMDFGEWTNSLMDLEGDFRYIN